MRKKRFFKAAVALLLSASMLTGCSLSDIEKLLFDGSEQTDPSYFGSKTTAPVSLPQVNASGDFAADRSTMLSLGTDNSLVISRRTMTQTAPMGEAGMWTVFVYLCGTDLESGGAGQASEDLREMMEATEKTSKLRFVVETGGTYDWSLSSIKGRSKQRILVSNGGIETVYSGAETNMGDQKTLSDFIIWGLSNYASEKMGFVFWNHGGGSISGVCFDEIHHYDSLSLREIEGGFSAAFPYMTDKFEFIGFDACLMATVEAANILVPFSRYMIASEELESGYGWKYQSFGTAVAANPSANGEELGKTICDGFFKDNQRYGDDSMATLSVVNLDKLDAFLVAFNSYAESLYKAAGSSDNPAIVRAISGVENYGGNNRTEGYTNMVDLGGIIKSTASYTTGANEALRALQDCVVYKVQGYLRSEGYGLAAYYPLCVQGSSEITTLKDICISPYYVTFVDLVAYSGSTNGTTGGFDDSDWLGDDSWFWNDDASYGSTNDDEWYWGDSSSDSGDSYNFDAGLTAISYSVYPHTESDGSYCLTVSPDSLAYLSSVYCKVMMSATDGDKELMIDFGTDDYVNVNWSTGEISDNFDGYWFSLPDGQPLAVYLIEQHTEYNIYSAPVYLNGGNDVQFLRIQQTYSGSGTATTVLGVVSGIDAYGSSARESEPLKSGDKITPCYYAYDAGTGDFYDYYVGDEYSYTGSGELSTSLLYEGDYYYGYELHDIYGSTLNTDFTLFAVDSYGETYFYNDSVPEGSNDEIDNIWGWGGEYDWQNDNSAPADDEWLFN